MWECTPPSLSSPIKWSWCFRARSMACRNSGTSKKFFDTAGANVRLAPFAIAHLTVGQSHIRPRSMDQGVREFPEQFVISRLACESDGVAFGFLTIAPSIQDGKHNWFW